jgi:hypothetical protein
MEDAHHKKRVSELPISKIGVLFGKETPQLRKLFTAVAEENFESDCVMIGIRRSSGDGIGFGEYLMAGTMMVGTSPGFQNENFIRSWGGTATLPRSLERRKWCVG